MGKFVTKIAFPYYGGKWKLAPKIVSNFPRHGIFVDVFGGSAAIILRKKPSKIEVYNDINMWCCDFFRVIRDPKLFGRFCHFIYWMPYSRSEYYRFLKAYVGEIDVVTRAAMWYYISCCCFSGLFGKSFSIAKSRCRPLRWSTVLDRLPSVRDRMKSVYIENLDFRKVIQKYDDKDALFYLDPPYVHSTRDKSSLNAYQYDDLVKKDHKEMCKLLLGIKGKAIVSGYRNKIYKKYLEGSSWEILDIPVKSTVGTSNQRSSRVERLWFNF